MTRTSICAKIIEMQKKGRISEAQTLIDQNHNELTPAEFAECVGNQYFAARKFQEAANYYEQSIQLEPEHIIARYQYLAGIQEHQNKNYVAAFDIFTFAIESEPEFVDPYVELGAMLMKVGDAKGALKCFEDALSLEPDEIGNHYNIVAALKELEKEDKATYGTRLQNALAIYEQARAKLPPLDYSHVHEMPKL